MKKLIGLIFLFIIMCGLLAPTSAFASTGTTTQTYNSGLLSSILSYFNRGNQNQTTNQTSYNQSYQTTTSNINGQYSLQSGSNCWSWLTDLLNCFCNSSGGQNTGGNSGNQKGDDSGCDNGDGGKGCFSNTDGKCTSEQVWEDWYCNL